MAYKTVHIVFLFIFIRIPLYWPSPSSTLMAGRLRLLLGGLILASLCQSAVSVKPALSFAKAYILNLPPISRVVTVPWMDNDKLLKEDYKKDKKNYTSSPLRSDFFSIFSALFREKGEDYGICNSVYNSISPLKFLNFL